MKIKNIFISQPKPESDRSPYFDIAKNHKVTLSFRPFIHVEGSTAAELRKQRIDLTEYGCVILTSKNAVDHYFRLAAEMRYNVPETTKYFCTTEAIALYLQKYIVYRKRKIFHGKSGLEELIDPMRKNKDEKFIFPCSDKHRDSVTIFLENTKVNFTKAIFYKTVYSDMKDLDLYGFDMLVFFSSNGIESLFANFPDFDQKHLHIATFGTETAEMAKSKGLTVQLMAPMPQAPSMAMAIDLYLKDQHAKSGGKK
jgi:uroporphyrinogen-III synthase